MKKVLKSLALVTLLTVTVADLQAADRELDVAEQQEIVALKGNCFADHEANFVKFDWRNTDHEIVVAVAKLFLKDLSAEKTLSLLQKLANVKKDIHEKRDNLYLAQGAFASLFMDDNGVVSPNGIHVVQKLYNALSADLTASSQAIYAEAAQLDKDAKQKQGAEVEVYKAAAKAKYALARELSAIEELLCNANSDSFMFEGADFHNEGGAAAAAAQPDLPSYDEVTK